MRQVQTTGSNNKSSKKGTPRHRRNKHVYLFRLLLGVAAIATFTVITQVTVEGWEAISNALFGGFTLQDVVRYAVIVVSSIMVGYWIKRPRKNQNHEDDKQQ